MGKGNRVTPPPLRILINAIHAHSGGGVTYLRNLLPALAADPELDVLVCYHRDQEAKLPVPEQGIQRIAVDFRDGFVGRLVWEQLSLPGLARRLGADVVYSPANFGPLLVPNGVIMLRNALAVGQNEDRIAKRVYWWVLALMTRWSLRRCRRAIAVSAYAADALSHGLPQRVQDKIAVVHHGVGPEFTPDPTVAREDFLLCVGDLYIQKNFGLVLAALAQLAPAHPGLRLKVAGRPVDQEHANGLYAEAARLGLEGRVDWLGHVAPADLAGLYRRCRLFVFPSLVETFGHPLAEAMACGAPVLSSDAAAMPEVAGGAALYFGPRDQATLTATLTRALADPTLRADLSARALVRAGELSWAQTAAKTIAILKAAAHR